MRARLGASLICKTFHTSFSLPLHVYLNFSFLFWTSFFLVTHSFIVMVSTKAPGLEALDMELQTVGQNVPQNQNAGTALDNSDMHRMGKVQELKVRLHDYNTGIIYLTYQIEKLTTRGCSKFCFCFAGNMGVYFNVSIEMLQRVKESMTNRFD
jgi:hypothetical protein